MGYDKVETKLPESAKKFLIYCKINRRLSILTVERYDTTLRVLFNFLHKQNRKSINDDLVKKIKVDDLNNFEAYLLETCGNEPTTVTTKVSIIKAYFKYLQNVLNLINNDPTYDWLPPEQPQKEVIKLSLNQSIKLLDSLDKQSCSYLRDKCILILFLHCGLRSSELANIKLKEIKENRIKIWGKGAKERTIILNDTCLNAIKYYIKYERKEDEVPYEDRQYLFISTKKTHLKYGAIKNMVKKYVKKAGLADEKITPHKLRATYASIMNDSGANIRYIQKSLGHSSIKTTQKYIGIDMDKMEEMVNNNPLNKLK